MNDIIKHKQEFIDELMKIGYTVYINREDLSEIRIKGKDTSIVCNLKTTRHQTQTRSEPGGHFLGDVSGFPPHHQTPMYRCG